MGSKTPWYCSSRKAINPAPVQRDDHIMCCCSFFSQLLGNDQGNKSLTQWLQLPFRYVHSINRIAWEEGYRKYGPDSPRIAAA